jgi:hypothetical protein
MAQNNDSPGKRLKREEAKNTLYVSRPDDPRLRAYQDSASTFNNLNRYYSGVSKIDENKFFNITDLQEALSGLQKKYPVNNSLLSFSPSIQSGVLIKKFNTTPFVTIHKDAKATAPKRKVVFRPEEPIEPLTPRQAPSPILTREEIIAPVPRPVDVPPAPHMKEPMMEEETITERPVARKPPKAVMPRRAGGWANQPLLMQLFPKLYER